MSENPTQLRVAGLTRLQMAELRSALATTGDKIAKIETPKLGGGKLGEPVTVTVILTLAPSVIAAVAVWLAKQKKRRSKHIVYTKIDPKGGMESFEIDESAYEEGKSSSSAIQALLEKKLGYDPRTTG